MRKLWTKQEREILIQYFSNTNTKDLANQMGRTYSSVAIRAQNMGLRKSEEFHMSGKSGRLVPGSEIGKNSRFTKGHTTFNKGKTWDEYMSEEARRGSAKTTFKPGHIPASTVHFGKPYLYTRTRKNGHVEKTWKIQIAKQRLSYLAHLCRINGIDLTGKKPRLKPNHQIPPVFEDIIILSERDNMIENSFHRFTPEVKDLIHVKALLTRYINKRK